jgi:hypothetical protein
MKVMDDRGNALAGTAGQSGPFAEGKTKVHAGDHGQAAPVLQRLSGRGRPATDPAQSILVVAAVGPDPPRGPQMLVQVADAVAADPRAELMSHAIIEV